MKVSVAYMACGKRSVKKIRLKKHYHAVVIPVHKGVWYFHVDFKVHVQIAWYGSDDSYDESCYLQLYPLKGDEYAVVTFDFSEEKKSMNFYGVISKTSYHGIIIQSNMISRAWDRFNNRGRRG